MPIPVIIAGRNKAAEQQIVDALTKVSVDHQVWYQNNWGPTVPDAGYADGAEPVSELERAKTMLEARLGTDRSAWPESIVVSLDREDSRYMAMDNSTHIADWSMRASKCRIAALQLASGGRAEVYAWGLGVPDNEDGVEWMRAMRATAVLRGAGFVGHIAPLVPWKNDPDAAAHRARQVVEQQDLIVDMCERIRWPIQRLISMQPFVRRGKTINGVMDLATARACHRIIGNRPRGMWLDGKDEQTAELTAKAIAEVGGTWAEAPQSEGRN